jgi:hypothetical protein
MSIRISLLATLLLAAPVFAQRSGEFGYVYPAGGKAGTTVDVVLGGYNWTPDMDFVVFDPRVKLAVTGPLSPIIIPPPPYWFGAKGRLANLPLPKEFPAKITIPADAKPGPLYWQAANASNATLPIAFYVGEEDEVVEEDVRKSPQLLRKLPATVNGRLLKNEEIDRYRFTAAQDGPITLDLMVRRLGTKFLGMMQVHDKEGRLVADIHGAHGDDPVVTIPGKAGAEYTVSIHDVDFAGDRSFAYRLSIAHAPRVLTALPAAGKRGETRDVEFQGIGIATGGDKFESVTRKITFPKDGTSFEHRLDTKWGKAAPVTLLVSEHPQILRAASPTKASEPLTLPASITGILDQPDVEHVYSCQWKKGEVWSLTLSARRIGSPLDVSLAILGPKDKEVARSEDLPGTTDAGLEYMVPADGTYQVVVSDTSGRGGSRLASYHLEIRPATPDFELRLTTPRVLVPIGGKFDLPVKAIRRGGFKGAIALKLTGLPAGVVAPAELAIAEGKTDLSIPLTADDKTGTGVTLVELEGRAMVGSTEVTRKATATTTTHLSTRDPDENQMPAFLVAATMKPRFKGRPVDADTGRKVPRGATHPAEVILERLDGWDGEVTLQMAAQQSYQVQGITGGDVVVPPGVEKAWYPCYMPEWLETTRTSRMGMIATAQVADPKGRIRYLVGDIAGFVTMTMEGALLKVSCEDGERKAVPGKPFDVRLKIARVPQLTEPVKIELHVPREFAGKLKAMPITLNVGQDKATIQVTPSADLSGLCTFSFRGTALKEGKYPVISETNVVVEMTRE